MSEQWMLGAVGASVAAIHRRLIVLGLSVPAEERNTDMFGTGTETAIRDLQGRAGLPVNGVVDDATARTLGLEATRPRAILGVVSQPDGTPLADVVVRVYLPGARSDTLAGETRSGSDGSFSLPWPSDAAAGVIVCADGGDRETLSAAATAANGSAWLRLCVGGPYRGVSRFAALYAALSSRIQGATLNTLGDGGRDTELRAVSVGTGVSASEVARMVLVHKLEAETKIRAAVFFALFAQHLPAAVAAAFHAGTPPAALDDAQVSHVLDAVLQLRPDNLRAALAAAVADGTIDPLDTDAAVTELQALRVANVASRPYRVGKTPFRDVLATAISEPAVQQHVFASFATHGASRDFWATLEQAPGITADQLDALRFTLNTAVLMRNHLPLIRYAQQQRAIKAIARPSDLARFDQADWNRLIRQTDPKGEQLTFIANLKFDTVDERIDHFAQMLSVQFERRFPTSAFAGRFAKHADELKLSDPAGVQHFLDSHPTFSLRRTHIDRFLHDQSKAASPAAPAGVVADLKKVQRMYKLTKQLAHVRALLGAGHTSAQSIYLAGRKRIVSLLTDAGASRRTARGVFARAAHVHATTIALLGNFHGSFTAVTPRAVAQPLAPAVVAPMLASFPNLQSLFGSTDYCACASCRAIHGPAAYFVDILQFLKHRSATSGTALDVVLGRRPDLGQLELSCDNTNLVVPYVDLVCEVLEDAVAAPSTATLRARQTTGRPEELRANPQFVNGAAYAALRAAVFPASAPFDLWTAEVRAFLAQLGVTWSELLAAYQIPASGTQAANPTDVQIAGEQLGWNAGALTLATTAAPSQPWTHWGLSETTNTIPDPRKPDDTGANITGTWLQVLGHVPVVLQRAGIDHRVLVQLLATRFINPGGAITIVEAATGGFASCDTGKQTVTTWTADTLSRFERFLRLWRQLGCTIWDLDKALATAGVGNNAIDGPAVVQLARLAQLATRFALPWDEMLGLWADLDHVSYMDVLDDDERPLPSVYARRFLNATVTQSSSVFPPDPAALAGQLGSPDAIAGISGALGLSVDDIQAIRTATHLDATTAPLNLANLSVLFRHAVLAGALRMRIADLLTAIAVAGVDPFAGPASTLAFLAALDQVQASGFSLAELNYLLRHGAPADAGIALSEATIAGWVDDLRKGLVRLSSGRDDLVQQRISDLLPLDPALTQRVVQLTLPGQSATIAALFQDTRLTQQASDGSFVTPSSRTGFAAIFDAFVVLDKLRTVLARWRVSIADARWLLDHAVEAGWLALSQLPASAVSPIALVQLDALHRNVRMQQTLAASDGARLFDVVLTRGGARDIVAGALAALGGWAASDVIALATRFGWTTGASLVAGATAPRIRDLLAWPRKLGSDVPTTIGFVTTTVGDAEPRKARQLTKARYDLDTWYAIAGAVQDGLREQKRAALVAWLLAHPDATRGQRWFDVEQLYGHCLIDPEMSPVATTTRMKQAAASIQLFVQRCLLQVEPSVSVNVDSDGNWHQWDWMKRFRLWEANRKIFLYPENWIDPSQRRGKSSFFTELERELQQGDMSAGAAETALRNYLFKLSDVAHLEITGVAEHNDFGQRILHVVGRTRKQPHEHYFRQLGATGVWSPWEKLDVEIPSDHVMPVYWNRRLHVVWPELTEKSLPPSSTDRTAPIGKASFVAADPARYWEVRIGWSERGPDRWSPKRLTKRPQLVPRDAARKLVFKAPIIGRNLEVDLYRQSSSTVASHFAQWQLTSTDDEPAMLSTGLGNLAGVEGAQDIGVLAGAAQRPALVASSTMIWDYNGQASAPGATTLTLLEGNPQQSLAVLNRTSQLRLTSEHQDPVFVSQSPFFLADAQRTFFLYPSFVATQVYSRSVPSGTTTYSTQYSPTAFYHPFVRTFLQELAYGGVDALYARALQNTPDTVRGTAPFNFAAEYQPTTAVRQAVAPAPPYPIETIDYSHDGAYAAYNWELFFHAPLLIAQQLAANQQFDDALRWFHYIFNPTITSGGSAPQRYWIPRVFFELSSADTAKQQIENLLQLISQHDSAMNQAVAAWRNDPFDPHLIAATRPVAYQKAVVMQYIQTLIAWGDQLFRGDTIESINEATQLYLLASELLGPRPQNLRALQPTAARTYNELATQLDDFSNALVDIENVVSLPPPPGSTGAPPLPQLHTFYFCVPPNEKLLAFWDTVADRLFKIRHSLNLDGVQRPLALYEPAIDPGLLARAAAAGLDASIILADIEVDQPCYRFQTLWQVAREVCDDVRGLGAAILSALERRDAEDLARVRATQELAVLDLVRTVKITQLAEARASRTALDTARELAEIRRDYYATRDFMNAAEVTGLALGGAALGVELAAQVTELVAAAAYAFPSITAGGAGFGGSPLVTVTTGGNSVGSATSTAASALRSIAGMLNQGAGLANTVGGYQRRRDEWDLQRRIAEKEITQIDRQLIAADLRISITQQELDAQTRQVEDARVTSEMLTTKFTNRELYDWLVSQLSTTYFQSYQLAYDLAKRASKAYAFELGTPDPGIIQFGYWDSLHKGLCAGDRLLHDLRRLQAEHLELNRRELELTKHVSLLQLDPAALVALRQTGQCFINLPESVFDLDQPGHYLRRLKSVSVTLPCVTGPYTGINATLTLVSHATRTSMVPGAKYTPDVDADGVPLASDTRFSRGTGAVQSVALSTGREDAGLFEVNFHDERYLPFEGLGVISHWRLELPRDVNRFDVSTLSDVVVHLRYTARDGGQTLRTAARDAVTAALPRNGMQLLSARRSFPDAWAKLWAPIGAGQRLDLALDDRFFPYVPSSQRQTITSVKALMLFSADQTYSAYQGQGTAKWLQLHLGFSTSDGSLPSQTAIFTPDAAVNQLPTAMVAVPGPVAPLSLAFVEADVAKATLLAETTTEADGAHARLDRDQIDDILLLVNFRTEAR